MLSEQKQLKFITPADIRAKALRIWQKGDLLSAWLNGDDMFPLEINFRKPRPPEMLECFEQVRDWIVLLQQHSKAACGKGYNLEFRHVQHRKMGEQHIPSRICFACEEDFLSFIQQTKAYLTFQRLAEQTLNDFPSLSGWLNAYPLKLLKHAQSWPQLLRICDWFGQHPRPNRYIRELEIEGVDSKFIEQHKAILSELLQEILPSDTVDTSVSGLTRHGFERRFGLKYDEPLIRFRLLDADHNFSDLSVPFSHFAAVEPDAHTIIITENKINGLSFPAMPDTMVVFGLGYGIEILKGVKWLQDKQIIYWGDIDSHGFAILSQLRGYFPQVTSLCMDTDTLQAHKSLWGKEPEDKRCMHDLLHLTADEQRLFQQLQSNTFSLPIRLEQERINHHWLRCRLHIKEPPC